VKQASAQAEPAATAIDEIKPLKIGDKVPDELWDQYFPVVSTASDQTQMLSLGDYKDKLIILDFWATWCAPCISSLYKLDTLQKEFKDDLMIIPTSYEPEGKVRKFFKEKSLQLPTAFEETLLKRYFPHQVIPHQVWLKDGKVLAITTETYTNETNIRNAIDKQSLIVNNKLEDLDYKPDFPLLVDYNGGTREDLLYQSMITRYIPGIISEVRTSPSILATNQSAFTLYEIAFMKGNVDFGTKNRMILEVSNNLKDKIAFPDRLTSNELGLKDEKNRWMEQNVFCYNLILPNYPSEDLKQRMLQDLNDFFKHQLGIVAKIERRKIPAYAITNAKKDKKPSKKKPVIKEGDEYRLNNKPVRHLISTLSYKNQDLGIPIIDQTNGMGKISILLSYSKLNKIPELKEELNHYGLDIEKGLYELEVLVISELKNR